MWPGRRFSSLFPSLSPPTSSPSTPTSTSPSSSSTATTTTAGIATTPSMLSVVSSTVSDDHRQPSSMPLSTSSSTRRRRRSSSSPSPSSSPLSSIASSSSWWWLLSALFAVVLVLGTHPLPVSAVDSVAGLGKLGAGLGGAGTKLGRGAAVMVGDSGSKRMAIKNLSEKKSILKSQIDGNGPAVRAAVKKAEDQNRQTGLKEQTGNDRVKKDSLLKQLEEHEAENDQKQKDMRKREQQRHQRQQLVEEQLQQQQQRVVEDTARRERQKQRDQEQKWLEDMQKKVAEKARQEKEQDAGNNDKAADFVPAHQNNIRSHNVKDNLGNQNIDINNVPIAGAIPTVPPARARLASVVTPKSFDETRGKVPGGFVLEQNKQQGVVNVNAPIIEGVAMKGNNNNLNGENDRLGIIGMSDKDQFPSISKRKRNNYNNDDNNNNMNNLDGNNNNDNNNQNIQAGNRNSDLGNMNLNVMNNDNNNNDNNNNDVRNNDNGNGGGQPFIANRLNDGGNLNNFNSGNNNNNNPPPHADVPPMGGININWDWEDFSIMFENYGGAEMKVRRAPHATRGEPWPLPQYYSKKANKVYKVSRELRFMPTGHTCDILEEAMARHLQRVLRGSVEDMYDNLQNAEGSNIKDPSLKYEQDEFVKAPVISRVELRVRKACAKYPSLESDESYDLVVKKKRTFIYANEIWGVLRGLETLGQLVWRGTDGILYIKETVISDYPRFPHRGLHIDTSRHFLFKEVLLDIMDSMEMNKLNVFHWHIVDDQSFPYDSKVYPELSRKGAYHPTYVYSLEDIAELIEYARLRGIRVLPEFDTPGHTYSWGLSRPELLTQCFSGNTPVKGYLGPMDPSKNSTYRFLSTLFQEVMDVFKDQFLHLGGDEVPLGCWQSNPEVMAFANELNRKHQENMAKQPSLTQQQQQQNYNNYGGSWSMWSDEIKRVYEYYENRLIKLLNEIGHKRKAGVRYIMWQEVINNNLQLPNDTIIQVWMGDMGDVMRATSLGYNVLYSTCWYLDHLEYGTKWPKYYHCDPVDQSYGYHIDEKKVLGGEAAFWSEYFTNENLIPMMWPRAAAVAERLWSNKEVKNLDQAAERLSEHRCRMIKRGINAGEISGPGYCLHSPPKRRLFNDTIGCKGANCSRLHNFVEIEDIQVHLSQRGGGLSECGNVFSRGDTGLLVVLILICVLVLFMVTVTRSSPRLGRMRHCKNRSILLVFVFLLLIYFLCYTTIGLRAFEFSGSIHKTFQEDKRGQGKDGLDGFQDQKRLMS